MANGSENIAQIVVSARASVKRAFPIEFREKQLMALLRLCEENRESLCDALSADLGRCEAENILLEVNVLKNDIIVALNEIHVWTKVID
jgi:acyl-CoA reductase-like NAD-dependent aldehyde dehydrogenase